MTNCDQKFTLLALLATLLASSPVVEAGDANPAPVRFGTLGGSLTNEYQFVAQRNTARNWIEQLASLRAEDVDFGSFSTTRDGLPQREGYDYNWAAGGRGAAATIVEERHLALAEQVAAGQVDLVVLDLSHGALITPFFQQGKRGADLEPFAEQLIDNLTIIADVLEQAGEGSPNGSVHIVLGNCADFGVTPAIQGTISAATRAQYTLAVMQLNVLIQQLADQRGYPVLDFFAWANLAVAEDPPVVGGVELDASSFAFYEPNPDHFFEDSQHPGSIMQGVLANMVVEAANRAYGLGIEPLSEQEMVSVAYATAELPLPEGATPGPTFFDVSRLVQYNAAPQQLLLNLADSVAAINLVCGIENSLDAKLDASLNAMLDAFEQNDAAVIGSLNAFVNSVEAQSAKKISPGHAYYLSTAADMIVLELLE